MSIPNILSGVKTVFLDMFGTLVTVDSNFEEPLNRLFNGLKRTWMDLDLARFRVVYRETWEKYHEIRVRELREVTNAIWVAEALNRVGIDVEGSDERITMAVDEQFSGFEERVTPVTYADEALRKLSERFDLCLVSNFTYAPTLYRVLRRLGFLSYLRGTIISDELNIRKPHPGIFKAALELMNAEVESTVMVGNDIREDIAGAKGLGVRALLLDAEGTLSSKADQNCGIQPDLVIKSLRDLPKVLAC